MKTLKHFMLPEQTNQLYKNEAASSIALTRDVAKKINELVDAYNELSKGNLAKEQEQDGRIRKGILYMKDNLINTIHDMFQLLHKSGDLDGIVTDALNNDITKIKNKTIGFVSVMEYGAKGDGISDDSKAIQSAINALKEYETLVIPNGTFLCTGLTINTDNVKIIMNGRLKQKGSFNGNLLTVRGKNIHLVDLTLERECTMYGSSKNDMKNIGLRIEESKNVFIDNAIIKNFNVGIDVHSDLAGCAYVEIKNPYIVAHECIKTSGTSWTNEIHVNGGRLSIHETYGDYSGSAYANLTGDCFRFNSVCMEGTKVERKIKGNYANSSFIGCRFEGTNASGTDIDVPGDWNLFLHNRDMGLNIVDEGTGNNFLDFSTFKFNSAISTRIKHFESTAENNKLNLSWQMPLLFVDASQKSATISTPNVTSEYEKGVEMTVKKIDASENTVYVYFRGGEADGISDTVLRKQNEAITFVSDGAKWYIKNWYKPE